MNDLPKIIILSNSIIDREHGIIIERDLEKHDRLWLHIPGLQPHYFDGTDAVQLWRFYDTEAGWQEK